MNNSVIFSSDALKLQGMRTPTFVLCKPSRERIGTLQCINRTLSVKYNDIGELSFDVYRFSDGDENEYYDLVKTSKYIYLPDIGYYRIIDCTIQSENTDLEYKSCTAQESSCTLMNKKLDTFTINMGTDESIDGVQFYNINDKEKSLLHLVLNQCPEWGIGVIDQDLIEQQRSFEVDYQDVYSFLTQDVSTAFECVFFFDTLTNTISAYPTSKCGKDTSIHISHQNLAKSFSIQTSDDDIVTGLRLEGEDSSVTIRELNMGYEIIYNLDYYHDPEYMSTSLFNAYTAWQQLWNDNVNEYTELLNGNNSQNQLFLGEGKLDFSVLGSNDSTVTNGLLSLLAEVNRLRYNMDNDGTVNTSAEILKLTDFSDFSLNGLNDLKSIIENSINVYAKLGYAETENDMPKNADKYATYQKYINKRDEIQSAIDERTEQINDLYNRTGGINNIYARMNEIQSIISMQNNFTEDELKELSEFIKIDELVDSNFVITDSMTEEERQEMLQTFLDYGRSELEKKCQPTYQFTASLGNLFELKEFSDYADEFICGNNIIVTIHNNYRLKVKILSFTFDFDNRENFEVTFGNVMATTSKNIFTDITNAVSIANKAASSVSFNSSKWAQAADATSEISKVISNGLLSAGYTLTDGSESEVVLDKRGLFVKSSETLEDGTTNPYKNDQIFLGGGRILFTEDNFATVGEAVGRIDVNGESVFGVIAKAVIAGLIMGTTINGGTITGTSINNGSGTFSVDSDGKTTCSDLTITGGKITLGTTDDDSEDNTYASIDEMGKLYAKNAEIVGKITATELNISGSATIGGFSVDNTRLYTDGKSSISSGNGILISSTNGIGLGNNKFYVDKSGNLTCANATMNQAIIKNGKFATDSSGNVTCSSIKITGDSSGSTTIGNTNVDASGNIVSTSSGHLIIENTDPTETAGLLLKYSDGSLFSLIRTYATGNNPNIVYDCASGGNVYLGAFNAKNVIVGSEGSSNKPDFDFYYAEGESITCSDTVTATIINQTSDQRLKDKISDLNKQQSYNLIMNLQPKSFTFKDDKTQKEHHGLIAQDVLSLSDNNWGVVSEFDYKDLETEEKQKRYSLGYTEFIADLIGSVQYLSQQVSELQNENKKLKSRLSNIELAIEKLQKGIGNV